MQGHNTDEEAFPVSPAQLDHLRQVERLPTFRWSTRARVRIEGEAQPALIESAFQDLIQRHEVLRTGYRTHPGTGDWIQLIVPDVPFRLETRDLRGCDQAEQAQRLDELAADIDRQLDPTCGVVLRAALATVDDSEHRLLMAQPTVTNDLFGLHILIDELLEALEGTPRDEPMQFADIAQFLSEAQVDSKEAQGFWEGHDGAWILAQHLPWEAHRERRDTGEEFHTHPLPGELRLDIEAYAQQFRVNSSDVYFAAWQVLLMRHCDSDDVVTGYHSVGRSYEGLEQAIGLFARHLPVASRTNKAQGFSELCKQVHTDILRAEDAHEAFSYESLDAQHGLTWPFGFEFRETPKSRTAGGLTCVVESSGSAYEPFGLRLVVRDGLDLQLCFDPSRHARDEVALYAEQYEALLREALTEGSRETAPCELSLLPAKHRDRLLASSSDQGEPLRKEDHVLGWFAKAVAEHADEPAVTCENGSLDYRQLDHLSDRIAASLKKKGVEAGDFVGLYFERCAEMVAAILGTLKAGGAYLPLPPDYPRERLQHMLSDAAVSCVLTRRLDASTVPSFEGELIHVDEIPDELEWEGVEPDPDSPAYVIYTSGSSGRPKGVPITHANLAHSTRARLEVYEHEVGAYLLLSSFAFDSSVAGIFWTLTQGGTLVLPPAGFEREIPSLARAIQEHGITHLLCLPSLWNAILGISQPGSLNSLTTVIVAGESCQPEVVEKHREALPRTKLYNEYGPTEATVWSTVYDTADHRGPGPVPIGRAIPGAETYVLDEQGDLSPIGVAGELHVGGAGVSRGYRNRPDLTRERFVANSFAGQGRLYRTGDRVRLLPDGELEFLGRMDNQVKVRGYRIELGEIEAVIGAHSLVRQTAVIAAREGSDVQLLAYLTTEDEYDEQALRAHLESILPDYMVPSAILEIDDFPLLPNGKIDRVALESTERASPRAQETAEAPESDLEKVIAHLWGELLGKKSVSRNDDFFLLGGHSILATQLYARILELLGIKMKLRSLFEKRVLRAFARDLLDHSDEGSQLERRATLVLQVLELEDDDPDLAASA